MLNSMNSRGVLRLLVALCAVNIGLGGTAFAQEVPKLDGRVAKQLERAKSQADAAAAQLAKGDRKLAAASLESADKELQKLRDWYKGKYDEAHPEVVAAVEQIAGLKKDLIAKAEGGDGSTPAPTPATEGDVMARVKAGLGKAQSAVSNMKTADADVLLNALQPDIAILRERVPADADAKRYVERWDSLRAEVDKKLPKKSDKLPWAVTNAIGVVSGAIAKLDGQLRRADANADELGWALRELSAASKRLGGALAEQKVSPEHPEVAPLIQRCQELEKAVEARVAAADGMAAGAAQAAEAVEADVKMLLEAIRAFDGQAGAVSWGGSVSLSDVAPLEQFLASAEGVESQHTPAFKAALEAYEAKYGSTPEAARQKARELGCKNPPASEHARAHELVGHVARQRAIAAKAVIAALEEAVVNAGKRHDFEVEAWLASQDLVRGAELGVRIEPASEATQAWQKKASATVSELLAARQARIDEQKWPAAHAPDAPSDKDALAALLVTVFEGLKGWGKSEKATIRIIAVSVRGPWHVTERNVLQEPIAYGFDILLAVEDSRDAGKNVIRVYPVTVHTESRPGVKPEPPFGAHSTGSASYYMRPEAIPGR